MSADIQRVGLVSCVKQKRDHAAPAAELYTSPLFRGARAAVERSCDRWFILSAEHHLVRPDDEIAPYDRTLNNASVDERRRWSRSVLDQLHQEMGELDGTTFEIHAGRDYYDWGLAEGLRTAGAIVTLPLEGLTLGQRLRYYSQADAEPAGANSQSVPSSSPAGGRPSTTRRGASKFEGLADHLADLERARWTATFAELEDMLGHSLPASAERHRAWWANTVRGHSHARAWLDAGFVVEHVDLGGGRVVFARKRP